MVKKINFTELNEEEIALVLSWRNDERIKKWMLDQNDILPKSHFKFIQNLKNDKTKYYFLVKDNDKFLGVIDLVENYLGIYSNPSLRGVGSILLKEIIDFAFKELNKSHLLAEVYKNNFRAINLYKRFNFLVINENKEFLIMELKNEN